MATANLRTSLDWGRLSPLRLRVRAVAEGLYSGAHRSSRRGAGIEFGGFREYTPGDDLRWLDRRALLLHDRYVVRQFETETDRSVRLLVDTTASMAYRGSRGAGAKLAYASVLAAAMARLALMGGDRVGVSFVGSSGVEGTIPAQGGMDHFEHILAVLEAIEARGDALQNPLIVERELERVARTARRGSVLFFFSDLLDLPESAEQAVARLASRGRILVVTQILDPDEAEFPFDGTLRLRAMEGEAVVETDPTQTREAYLTALGALQARWEQYLSARGGRLLSCTTAEDPIEVVRRMLEKAR